MADLLSNEEMLDRYFQSDDNESDFEGFSEQESDVDIPNAFSSDEDDGESVIQDEIEEEWSSQLRPVRVEHFTEETGPVFPDQFDRTTATPLDYFSMMFSLNIIPQIVRHTNAYARWKMEQSGEQDTVWYDVTESEMQAYFGINIFMGLNRLPAYKDYWSKDMFIGNEGIKSVMTVRRYEKLTEYFHVSDRATEPARGTPGYDKIYKVRPIIDMAKTNFKNNYKPNKCLTIDEAMIKWTGRLSFKQYLPAKPIKRGIKVWMRCDADNAFLTDFNIYLGRGSHESEHGLGYDVVNKLTRDLTNKYYHVFFDNYFTSVKLAVDLLADGIYSCGTVRINRKGFPDDLKKLKMRRGESKTRQKGNLTASVWQDKKPVAFLSTLSDPMQQVDVTRRAGRASLELTQPHSASIYNKKMNGVDRHDQLRTCYELAREGKKSWKYIFWFVMNCSLVNAFILFELFQQRPNQKKRFTHFDFRCELAHQLIGGFSSRKRKGGELGSVQLNPQNLHGHESVNMKTKRRCKVHAGRKERKETVFGCKLCNVHLCKEGCHYSFHNMN